MKTLRNQREKKKQSEPADGEPEIGHCDPERCRSSEYAEPTDDGLREALPGSRVKIRGAGVERRKNAGKEFGANPEGCGGESKDSCLGGVVAGIGVVEAEQGKGRNMMDSQYSGRGNRENVGLNREPGGVEAMGQEDERENQREPSNRKPQIGQRHP